MRPQYMRRHEGTIICTLCSHNCHIDMDRTGICGVRANREGAPHLPHYAAVSALHVDPIEKKPLYHLQPGASVLSVGLLGCNFRCPFCQNYAISQSTRAATHQVLPTDLAPMAVRSQAQGVAYTYNEPTIHFEYVMEAAGLVREAGLANVLVTNGHLNPRPARELLGLMDGVNVDLKSFSHEFYRDELGGSLDAVTAFIRIAAELTHVEVTTLLIPGRNDSDEEIDAISRFISSIDESIPMHLSAYHPTYRYTIRATTAQAIDRARSIARRRLRYVFAGNVAGDSDTRCHGCGNVLVHRSGYATSVTGIRDDLCADCGEASPIRWFGFPDEPGRGGSGHPGNRRSDA